MIKYFLCWTETSFFVIIPNFSSNAWIANTIFSVPNSCWWTFTSPSILIPNHSIDTCLNYKAKFSVPLCTWKTITFQGFFIPNFSIDALNTEGPIPIETFRAITLEFFIVPNLTTTTFRLNHTSKTIPKVAIFADTLFKCWVVNSSSRANLKFLTVITIPFISLFTLTWFWSFIPFLSIYALNAKGSIKI